MAIVANQALPPVALPPDFKRRVVVKFRPGTRLPYSRGAEAEFAGPESRAWSDLTRMFPGIILSPYFSTLEESDPPRTYDART
jgi:hypothetical protein